MSDGMAAVFATLSGQVESGDAMTVTAEPRVRVGSRPSAVAAMEDSPAKYRAMEPENGWGSYQGAVQARGQQTRPPRRRRRHQITRPCRPHQAPEHLQIPGHALAGAVLLLLADLAVHVTRSLS